ncbi:allophanate hydrolase [Acinetobacter bereziniae]|uniref:allophanate hydrolase n=1 Tax=Acinetobacter bereziniae TaxID=106648 RepID=UPI0015810613|nr:allophanate hydrolase [Acinetobacter bereziniae]NUF64222.1 allophanate hydrolase [Acinetobacter bereziniae]NUG07851.1 allophanate hydrolase [Acinetobacter bereziniae]NUG62608.1 allophanate hydrolase [Acinetobacter bereziniae]NUG70110.1 allophanate hydrolase [Acinetobacter bereziniae]NUG81235.1 allophanate hydrolase [Acinetobacter bereziniae]
MVMQDLWTIQDWKNAYANQQIDIDGLIDYVKTIKNDDHAWIEIASSAQIQMQIEYLKTQNCDDLPLYGVPFAVKDNIDVAGFHTTAACKDAKYLANTDAFVIAKLKKAGAVVVGKTNLDQFATGLVGVRSPYGVVKNSFNPEYISGGSSSGSSVAVANGIVPFSLGTDTAGSGRVPAGHNNIVGLKPTKGWFSTTGLMPACRTLDVISIFALTSDDAWLVATLMQGNDKTDAYSRSHPANVATQFSKGKIAIPAQLEFYGDIESEKAFKIAVERVQALGYEVESIDFTDFNLLARALYNDAWVAERTVAVEAQVSRQQAHPVIAEIIAQADQFKATDTFKAEYQRAELAQKINLQLQAYDALLVPTSPTIYRISEVEADPLNKNSHMGAYTNFVNFADLAAIALPNIIRADGLPSGVTFIASAWYDQALAKFAQQWQTLTELPLGTSSYRYQKSFEIESQNSVKLAVVGAHLSAMPLNFQLTTRQATLLAKTRTAKSYKLFALKNTVPPKPGLQFDIHGTAIEVEVWEIPLANFGAIVAEVPSPLGIGNLQLEDGTWVKGFICEAYAIQEAVDISHFGGWRAYIKSLNPSNTKFNCENVGGVSV